MQQGAGHPFYRKRLRYDSRLYLELSLCHEWGIPHSEFLNWSTEDRSKAIAFFYEKNERCDLCGTAEWEWQEDKRAYAPVEEFCMGCYLKSITGENSGAGTTIRLVPTHTQEHAKRLVADKRQALRNG